MRSAFSRIRQSWRLLAKLIGAILVGVFVAIGGVRLWHEHAWGVEMALQREGRIELTMEG